MKKALFTILVFIWLLPHYVHAKSVIQAIYIDGQEFKLTDDHITLRSSQSLTILFFDHPEIRSYHAQLQQENDTLIKESLHPLVIYNQLKKGHYTFLARVESDVHSQESTPLTIVVRKSLWGEWGFVPLLLLYLLLVFGGAGYIIVLSNFRSKEKLAKLRIDWTNKLHTDIGGDLSSASLRLDTLKRRLEPLDPRIKESVVKTYDILKEIQSKLRFVFDLIDPKKDSLHVMLTDIADFAAANLAIKNTAFNYHSELSEDESYPIDIGRVNKLYLVMKEVIYNCFKHAQANSVSLHVSHDKKGLNVLIQDDGVGFDPNESHQGNGIANLRAYAKEGLMDIDIQSEPGKGTTIFIFAPNI